jgi:DivIVA domain-containing protein
MSIELSPQAISAVEFDLVRRGYDPEQVRQFLQRLGGAVEELRSHLIASDARARAAMARVQELSAQQRPAAVVSNSDTESISRALLAAQKTADELVGNAKAHAVETVFAAEERAHEIVAAAHEEADEFAQAARHEARLQAEAEIATLLAERSRLQTDTCVLHNEIAELNEQIAELRATMLAPMVAEPEPALVSAGVETGNGFAHTNGHSNGLALSNGHSNGLASSNGHVNGESNGHTAWFEPPVVTTMLLPPPPKSMPVSPPTSDLESESDSGTEPWVSKPVELHLRVIRVDPSVTEALRNS